MYAVYRSISFFVTPVFLRARVSANAVSVLSVGLGALMPLVAAVHPAHAYVWLAALSFACLVLDCVDGNIARNTGSASGLGQYVDSLGGKVRAILLALALAVIAAREAPALSMSGWTSLALAAGLLDIWGRESRAYFKLYLATGEATFLASGRMGLATVVLSVPGLIPFALVPFGYAHMVHVLLCGLVLFHGAVFAATQVSIFARL